MESKTKLKNFEIMIYVKKPDWAYEHPMFDLVTEKKTGTEFRIVNNDSRLACLERKSLDNCSLTLTVLPLSLLPYPIINSTKEQIKHDFDIS
jgi:hypothetical protein